MDCYGLILGDLEVGERNRYKRKLKVLFLFGICESFLRVGFRWEVGYVF